jgi:hypothetical protein
MVKDSPFDPDDFRLSGWTCKWIDWQHFRTVIRFLYQRAARPCPSPKFYPRRKWPGSFSPPRELGRELLSAVTGVLLRGNARTHGRVIDGMMDEKIVWIRQPDRNDDATRRVGR